MVLSLPVDIDMLILVEIAPYGGIFRINAKMMDQYFRGNSRATNHIMMQGR
jgi:hypothetical protein